MSKELLQVGLSEAEQQFVYNIEVLGMSQSRAAEISGVRSPQVVLKRPEVIDAREKLRDVVRQRVEITKDDVIAGVKKAIDQADLLADPMAQIAGWREIAKMLGYDAPREIKVTISADASTRRRQIAQLDDDELIDLLDARDVIDAEFYEVNER
jgi:hypothetical protein